MSECIECNHSGGTSTNHWGIYPDGGCSNKVGEKFCPCKGYRKNKVFDTEAKPETDASNPAHKDGG